ncbi:MAG: DUF4382 domain-containing protein [Bacteroidetes bacterium]|nr:DUF4382 domain-containing protein [Bacteroidota bacterium]MBS1973218.1 DUF4382 domain-containing protein [Bacteroidota bacterium]
MKNKKTKIAIVAAAFITFGVTACKKQSSPGIAPESKQNVAVYLNDGPIPNLLKVLIDIRCVEVKVDTGPVRHPDDYYKDDLDRYNDHIRHDKYGRWDTLSITPNMYDLLKLRNGAEALIANGNVGTGKITKVRITLGANNSIWTDATHSFPLTVCDNNNYLYAGTKSTSIEALASGKSAIRIDFDVAKSIRNKNSAYCLKPHLKSYYDKYAGKIDGLVKPADAHALVKVFNATDTSYAIPEGDGKYKIRGLSPASYSVMYIASAPYRDTTITNVKVIPGQETKMPTITLHK